VTRWFVQRNIANLTELLNRPLDDAQRCAVEKLLDDQKQKLRELDRAETHG
jgi:hypothetical protein